MKIRPGKIKQPGKITLMSVTMFYQLRTTQCWDRFLGNLEFLAREQLSSKSPVAEGPAFFIEKASLTPKPPILWALFSPLTAEFSALWKGVQASLSTKPAGPSAACTQEPQESLTACSNGTDTWELAWHWRAGAGSPIIAVLGIN